MHIYGFPETQDRLRTGSSAEWINIRQAFRTGSPGLPCPHRGHNPKEQAGALKHAHPTTKALCPRVQHLSLPGHSLGVAEEGVRKSHARSLFSRALLLAPDRSHHAGQLPQLSRRMAQVSLLPRLRGRSLLRKDSSTAWSGGRTEVTQGPQQADAQVPMGTGKSRRGMNVTSNMMSTYTAARMAAATATCASTLARRY